MIAGVFEGHVNFLQGLEGTKRTEGTEVVRVVDSRSGSREEEFLFEREFMDEAVRSVA